MPAIPVLPDPGLLRKAATEVAAACRARLIVLFGSAARGDTRPAEDLDIGVLARSPLDAVAITNHFMRLLHVSEVDVTDLSRADPVLAMLVARDGIPLFEETPGEMTRFYSLAARRFADTRKFRDAQHQTLRDFIARTGAPG